MKYVRLFLTSFATSFGQELAVGTVWIWRGLYFSAAFLLVLKLFKPS